MTAVPCVPLIPLASVCEGVKNTYTAISSTDKDAKAVITLAFNMPVEAADSANAKLRADVTNTDGAMWSTLSAADGMTGSSSLTDMEAGKYGTPKQTTWKCEVNQLTKKIDWLADPKAITSGCKKGACHSDKAIAAELKEDKCVADTNAIAWVGGAMVVDAKTGTTITAVAPTSADGKAANTWNLAAKYSAHMGGYLCTAKCAKVTMAAHSGWFELAVTAAGATTLAASAAVATAALMF